MGQEPSRARAVRAVRTGRRGQARSCRNKRQVWEGGGCWLDDGSGCWLDNGSRCWRDGCAARSDGGAGADGSVGTGRGHVHIVDYRPMSTSRHDRARVRWRDYGARSLHLRTRTFCRTRTTSARLFRTTDVFSSYTNAPRTTVPSRRAHQHPFAPPAPCARRELTAMLPSSPPQLKLRSDVTRPCPLCAP